MKSRGFTLIELVVSAGVMAIVLLAISGILLQSFRARTNVKLADRIQTSGDWVISEMRKNVINAKVVNCAPGDLTVLYLIDDRGVGTTLFCDESTSKIASVSAARTINLTNTDVMVTDCSNFVVCETSSQKVKAVNFSFILNSGSGAENLSRKEYKAKVSIRE